MKSSVILVAFVLFSATAVSNIIYVPDDYSTIQGAIDASVNGDALIVRPGTYLENIDFTGKAITVRSESGPRWCTIDGSQSRVVTFRSGEGTDSVLMGFTITNGGAQHGGGICCKDYSSPTIIGNTISGNTAYDDGGGICCKDFSCPTIANNIITENTAAIEGGGLSCTTNSAPSISFNVISKNTSGQYGMGGGIFCSDSSSPDIANNMVSGNDAHSGGGIFCLFSSSPTILSNVIAGNSVSSSGGGIFCTVDSEPAIINNTIVNNTANLGGGVGCFSTSSVITNTILWSNSATSGPEIWIGEASNPASLTISHSDVQGGQSSVYVDSGCALNWGAGMIDSDPLFVDAAQGDVHLTCLSPCYGAGDNDAAGLGLPSEDFEGDPRVVHDTVDIGADEFFCHLYFMGDPLPGNTVNVRVAAIPGQDVTLYRGNDLLHNPHWTGHGYLYITWPAAASWSLGRIPQRGVLRQNITLPPSWVPGDSYHFQAQVGQWGNTYSWLTNLMTLTVE